jgi:DNA excision repair protein ERCC-2
MMTQLTKEVAKFFPYPEVRPHQDEFTNVISEAVEDGYSVLVEGSNGLGKTISALSACLPHAIDENLKILYVARTHRQHERVIEELREISKKQRISGISVSGRPDMCLHPIVTRHAMDARSAMEVCELLKARTQCPFYKNIDDKEEEYLEIIEQVSSHAYKASEIQKTCRSRGFCPYEAVKDALPDVRVVALSYLYVFDSAIRNAFLKNLNKPLNKILLIIDEAHNLPDTAIEIASSTLSLFTMKQAETEAKRFDYKDIADFSRSFRSEIEGEAEKIRKEILVKPEFLVELVHEKAGIDNPSTFFEHLNEVGSLIRRELLASGKYPRSFIHGMGEFLSRWLETIEDEDFARTISKYMSRQGGLTARLELVALDPSKVTTPVFSAVHSSIIMSGTLQPLEAYATITGLPENTFKSVVPSPFPKEHILPLICRGVTTAMEQRTPEMYEKIVERIQEVVENTPANIGVFTASFEVLQALLNAGIENAVDKPVFHEHRGMSSRENEKMVAEFKVMAKKGGAVLLGVQGGRSSEGVDYPGDQMNSVAIVGVPYAEPTPKVKAQIEYFDKRFPGLGREYGYVLPAMKKASQAAGRPVRTLEDRGAMVFLDYRFATFYCQKFLPAWLRNNLAVLPDEDGAVRKRLKLFFSQAY